VKWLAPPRPWSQRRHKRWQQQSRCMERGCGSEGREELQCSGVVWMCASRYNTTRCVLVGKDSGTLEVFLARG
jgi:hypothetical protein